MITDNVFRLTGNVLCAQDNLRLKKKAANEPFKGLQRMQKELMYECASQNQEEKLF